MAYVTSNVKVMHRIHYSIPPHNIKIAVQSEVRICCNSLTSHTANLTSGSHSSVLFEEVQNLLPVREYEFSLEGPSHYFTITVPC